MFFLRTYKLGKCFSSGPINSQNIFPRDSKHLIYPPSQAQTRRRLHFTEGIHRGGDGGRRGLPAVFRKVLYLPSLRFLSAQKPLGRPAWGLFDAAGKAVEFDHDLQRRLLPAG